MAISGPAAFRELQRREAVKRNFVPHAPHPKQREFLALDAREALYGGAAGGGKSDAMLMAAAQYIHVPGYAALLLRRTYKDLTRAGALLDRAKSWWLPHKSIRWQEDGKRFTFPSGATIEFGHLDAENDKYNYQGGEWQFIGVDELTQWPQTRYSYLMSRLRRLEGSQIPSRMRATANPGGIGHDWVKRRFVDGDKAFVPAALADNPSIDRDEYTLTLADVEPVLRKQLLEGIWVRDGSGLVYAQFDEDRNISAAKLPKLDYHLLGLDFGIVDQNAVTILGWRDNDPTIYVVASYRITALVTEMAAHVAGLERTWKFQKIVGDVGGLGKAFAEEMRRRFAIPIEPADKANKNGYISLFNGDLENGRIRLHPTDCAELVAEWVELPWDEARVKEMAGFNNHAADSCLYAWRAANAFYEQTAGPARSPQEAAKRAWEQSWKEADDLGESHTDPDKLWWQT